jgi:hypothetical protein
VQNELFWKHSKDRMMDNVKIQILLTMKPHSHITHNMWTDCHDRTSPWPPSYCQLNIVQKFPIQTGEISDRKETPMPCNLMTILVQVWSNNNLTNSMIYLFLDCIMHFQVNLCSHWNDHSERYHSAVDPAHVLNSTEYEPYKYSWVICSIYHRQPGQVSPKISWFPSTFVVPFAWGESHHLGHTFPVSLEQLQNILLFPWSLTTNSSCIVCP